MYCRYLNFPQRRWCRGVQVWWRHLASVVPVVCCSDTVGLAVMARARRDAIAARTVARGAARAVARHAGRACGTQCH